MADTTFIDQVTPVATVWLQQINDSVQRGINPSYVTSTGSANAQVITIPGAVETTLTTGQSFTFKAGYTNTAAMTLQVILAATTSAAALKNSVGVAVSAGTVYAGATYTVVWNGTYYELQGGVKGGGATGGGADTVFNENSLVVTTDYTLSTGKSAMSVGPITINSGIVVTIPSGYSWVIL